MAECPICLDNIGPHDLLGRVHECLHIYHKQCVIQWSSHSNSCPTCRKLYYGVDIVSNDSPNTVLSTLEVKDKLIENDAINDIPPEYIIPPPTYTDSFASSQPEESEMHSGVCTICSSARYSRTARSLLSCISCGAKFHKLCLGHTNEPFWFCPVCDCRQELIVPSRSRQPRRPAATVRRGLLIFNENNEIEDFDDADELVRPTSVLNGGILLRREARAIRNLTPEEASLWELLELARNGNTPAEQTTQAVRPAGARKKRRRPAAGPEVKTEAGSLAEVSGPATAESGERLQSNAQSSAPLHSGPSEVSRAPETHSRIASLMGQIKRRPQRAVFHAAPMPTQAHSPLTSETLTLADSDSGSEVDTKKTYSYATELTLDQKQMVQKHVRNHLRPLYNPRVDSQDLGLIRSEAEYIYVNKCISRKVYASILSLCTRDGLALEEYFADDESKLKELVDGHVEDWNLET